MFKPDLIERASQIVWSNTEMKLTLGVNFSRQAGENRPDRMSSTFIYDMKNMYENDARYNPILDGFSFYNNVGLTLERKFSNSEKKKFNVNEIPKIKFDIMDAAMMVQSLKTVESWLTDKSDSIFTKDGTGKITSVTHVKEYLRTKSGRMLCMCPEIITDGTNDEITYEGIGFHTDDVGSLGSMSPAEFISFKILFDNLAGTMVTAGNQLFMMSMMYGVAKNIQDMMSKK